MSDAAEGKLPMARATCLRMKAWMENAGMAEGEYLPSERELAGRFATSRVSVRQALQMLERDGWILRRPNSRPQVAARSANMKAEDSQAAQGQPHLGLLIHQASDAYALGVIGNLLRVAEAQGVRLNIEYVSDFVLDALGKTETLRRRGCSAVIVPWVPRLAYGAVAEFVQRSPLPAGVPVHLAGLERHGLKPARPDRDGTTLMVQDACRYFTALGYARLALLGPDSPGGEIMNRHLMAYILQIGALRLPSLCGFPGPLAKEMDVVAAEWASYAGELAVLCYDDEHALRLLGAMQKRGLAAPRDFAVIGCNNTPQCISADPPLTSFCMDHALLATKLLDLAVHLGTGRELRQWPDDPPLLVVRESCGGRQRLGERLPAVLGELQSAHRLE